MKISPPLEIKIAKARPILGNSSPEVLKPREYKQGTLQVVWLAELDRHALFFTFHGRETATILAMHNNGHSCAALADRICTGNAERSEQQREYIADCGGLACSPKYLASLFE